MPRQAPQPQALFTGVPVNLSPSDHVSVTDTPDRQAFINAMANLVTGVNVVTTDGGAGKFGLTVSAMTSLSADPPMLLVCINRRSPMCGAVRVNGRYCVNVLATRQQTIASCFAGHPVEGEPYDFSQARWHQQPGGAPQLVGAVASFDCVVESSLEYGSHTLFVGKVRSVSGEDGQPLLYTRRTYGHPQRWN